MLALAGLAVLLLAPSVATSASPGAARTLARLTADEASGSLSPLSANITATPLAGPAPLLVNFSLDATGGVGPYRYSWSFGDGNASSIPTPSHTFTTTGNYTALATVEDADGTVVSGSVAISVQALPLTVVLVVAPDHGSSTTASTFTAAVAGGSAPYVFAWSFGDGTTSVGTTTTITHSYSRPGIYGASVQVTDGMGSVVVGSARVDLSGTPLTVSVCPPLGRPCGPFGVSDAAWEIAGAGLSVACLAGASYLLSRRNRSADARPRPTALTPLAPAAGSAASGPSGATLGATTDRADEPSVPGPSGLDREPSATRSPAPDVRPLSDRILIHLYRQGIPDPNSAVPASFTQDGMSVALSRPQSAFARALLRLEEAGLVRSEVAHVQGRSRRAKTYRLTPQGESAARRIGAASPESSR
jgi:PKD repeat protein/DNA-binding MarR family transcriptional regulator